MEETERRLTDLRNALEGLFLTRNVNLGSDPDSRRRTVLAWIEDLADLGMEAATEAVRRFRRESSDFPTPAAVRRYAPGALGLTVEDRAALAWGLFREALRLWGHSRSLQFEDGAIHAAVRSIGGLRVAGESAALHFSERTFRAAYEASARTGCGDQSPLSGDTRDCVRIPSSANASTLRLVAVVPPENPAPLRGYLGAIQTVGVEHDGNSNSNTGEGQGRQASEESGRQNVAGKSRKGRRKRFRRVIDWHRGKVGDAAAEANGGGRIPSPAAPRTAAESGPVSGSE